VAAAAETAAPHLRRFMARGIRLDASWLQSAPAGLWKNRNAPSIADF
jgi:hypothetical protein